MTIFVTGTISALFSIGKNVTRKRRAGINPRDGNFETSSNSPRFPAEKSLPSFIIARWSMKLAARPKFVLHGAMMRNGVYGARRAPFYTVSKYYNSGGDTAGRDSIKISICFNGCSSIWRNGFDFGGKMFGKPFVIPKMCLRILHLRI